MSLILLIKKLPVTQVAARLRLGGGVMNIYPEVEFRDQVCMDAESVNRRWRRGGTRSQEARKGHNPRINLKSLFIITIFEDDISPNKNGHFKILCYFL